MKIRDIIEPINGRDDKVRVAYRIYKCSDEVKVAIKEWKEDGCIPEMSLRISASDDNEATLSLKDLVQLYGFGELDALLWFDSLYKAKKADNKVKQREMYLYLIYGSRHAKFEVPDAMLEHFKTNNPEAWGEYEKISENAKERLEELEKEFPRIIEMDI